jgi:hypothetical protein
MDRRTTIKWVLAAGATWPLSNKLAAQAAHAGLAKGYGTDPNLVANYHPGDGWPLTFTPAQRKLAGVLADIIIPADGRSPSASSIGVVEFIDEWVSAPYPRYQQDRTVVLGGFTWIDEEASRRFGKEFSALDSGKQHTICDDICDTSRATVERGDAARFFALYRNLTAGGFYSSPVGRKDLQYIGNVALASFDGAPPELLKALKLS